MPRGQNSETFLENHRARATRFAQFDYLDGMLGPPNAAAAGLARWRCGDQAVLRPDGDCWSDLSYYELPSSRPTRWMYENLMSFFSRAPRKLLARVSLDHPERLADRSSVMDGPPLSFNEGMEQNCAIYSSSSRSPRASLSPKLQPPRVANAITDFHGCDSRGLLRAPTGAGVDAGPHHR